MAGMEKTPSNDGRDIILATWIWLLHQEGFKPKPEGVRAACEAIATAGEGADMDSLGKALVEAIREAIPGLDSDVETVGRVVSTWFEPAHVATGLGDTPDREERVRNIRRYQFTHRLPWIALIADRDREGRLGVRWVLVQDVGEVVRIMDPYPWDQVDEQYTLLVTDFMVRWELAGLQSLRLV